MIDSEPKRPLFKTDFQSGPNTQLFFRYLEDLANTYHEAYAGFPWFEGDTVTVDVAKERLLAVSGMPGFQAFVVENIEDIPVAAEMFHSTTIEDLKKEKKN